MHLYSRHHHYVHEGLFEVRAGTDSRWCFFTPDGVRVHESGKLAPLDMDLEKAIIRWTDEHHLELSAQTSLTGWRGERMDYAIAVDALLGFG